MNKIKDYLIYVVLIALFGQVYFYPFNSEFRFSLSVIFLIIILFYSNEMDEIILSVFSGLLIVVFRSAPLMFGLNPLSLLTVVSMQGPAFIYYVSFGILFKFLSIRKRVEKNYFNIAFIIVIDSLSNIIELFFRIDIDKSEFSIMILTIVLVALLRTILIAVIVYSLEVNKIKQQKEKFRELIFINAGLNSEMFYLKKSTYDIENAMEISYKLYEEIEDKGRKQEALELSKNIHEIKKDYKRVIDGIKYNIRESLKYQMDFNELIDIIKTNSKKQISNSGKNIKMIFKNQNNFNVHHYYSLITIINNLIINAIDAIDNNGEIICSEFSDKKFIYIKVEDDGLGIKKEDIKFIFKPGFTTKYNEKTGKMSSGIGLIHVKNIVENIFNGEIQVVSEYNKFTKFIIKINKERMCE
jgi:two-component system sensor histidine kinase YcbA